MAQQTINIGTSANDASGDPLRDAFDKCNDNFNELYAEDTSMAGDISDNTTNIATNTSNLDDIVTALSIALGDTDFGAFTNALLTDSADLKQVLEDLADYIDDLEFQPLVVAGSAGPTITFDKSRRYGSDATPCTGNITIDETGARFGTWCCVIHNDTSEPTYGTGAAKVAGSQDYATSTDNYIYYMFMESGDIHYNIVLKA